MSVVLLHGLGRLPFCMMALQRAAKERGHVVKSPAMPTLWRSPEELVQGWVEPALKQGRMSGNGPVNVVTHSLGGILIRLAIGSVVPDWLGRVVMICPPNGGSEIVDFLNAHNLARKLIGPSGCQLGTNSGSLPLSLPGIPFECGVIIADKGGRMFPASLLPTPHDGKVSIRSMKSALGVKEYALVHSGHTFAMTNRQSVKLAMRFIETGSFGQ